MHMEKWFSRRQGEPSVALGEEMKCGMVVVDLKTGNHVAHLDITAGVDEVFDVAVLPGISAPFFAGPSADKDLGQPMWTILAG